MQIKIGEYVQINKQIVEWKWGVNRYTNRLEG